MYFMYALPDQMVRSKALARCGLVLLSLWLCIQSVPISVDMTKEKPKEEELEPPESAVSHAGSVRYREIMLKWGLTAK